MSKLSVRKKNAELLKEFSEAFPQCVDLDNPKPLAIGIFEQMSKTFDVKRLSKALVVYTSRKQYLNALIFEGAFRINADGSESEKVNSQHKAEAKLKLNTLLQIRKRKNEIALVRTQRAVTGVA